MGALHPNIRMPLWAAVVIPAAAYLVRSVARGFDFEPDLPSDVLVFGLLAILIVAVWAARRSRATNQSHDPLSQEMDDEDD